MLSFLIVVNVVLTLNSTQFEKKVEKKSRRLRRRTKPYIYAL